MKVLNRNIKTQRSIKVKMNETRIPDQSAQYQKYLDIQQEDLISTLKMVAPSNSWPINMNITGDPIFDKLRNTLSQKEIDEAVYGQDIYEQECVIRNPNLTQAHCQHLFETLIRNNGSDDLTMGLLVSLKEFPEDLLFELAHKITKKDEFTHISILAHPRVNRETKIVLGLRVGSANKKRLD